MNIAELFDLTGQVAVVTGGAAGLGRAIAARLSEAGSQVVIVDRDPNSETLAAKYVPQAAVVQADVAQSHVHAEIIARAGEPFGLPTILINNAGIYPNTPLLDATAEFFDLVFETNLRGVALMSVAFSKALVAAGRPGTIINLASVDAFKPSFVSGLAPYAATKGGVVALTRHMAVELAPHNISVNAIAPGTVFTDGVIRGVGGGDEELARRRTKPLSTKNLLRRYAEPDDIARVALFLASPAAEYIRGQTIVVDAGWTLGAYERPAPTLPPNERGYG